MDSKGVLAVRTCKLFSKSVAPIVLLCLLRVWLNAWPTNHRLGLVELRCPMCMQEHTMDSLDHYMFCSILVSFWKHHWSHFHSSTFTILHYLGLHPNMLCDMACAVAFHWAGCAAVNKALRQRGALSVEVMRDIYVSRIRFLA